MFTTTLPAPPKSRRVVRSLVSDRDTYAFVGIPLVPKANGKPASEPQRLRQLRICVIEDHEDTRTTLIRYLEHRGHEVISGSSMHEARALLEAAKCHLLICDIRLPDGTGWELLTEMQSRKPKVAVAVSGWGTMGDRARSKIAGFRHHLLKPLDPAALELILNEVIKESQDE